MPARAKTTKAPASAGGGNYFAQPKDKIEFISSGCTLLDLALGGGYATRRVINIVGDKATGKTLLAIEACANFARQYPKGKIFYKEAEAAFDQDYAAALGLPVKRIDFSDSHVAGRDAFETVEDLFEDLEVIVNAAKPTAPTLVIVDSLDALSDRAELARKIDEGTYGASKPKLLSQLFRRLVRKLEAKNVTLIIISQIRDKLNAMFGRKVTRSGGRALDFYASQIVYLAHTGQLTKTLRGDARTIGVKVRAAIDKNKVGLAHRKCDFQIRFGYGVDDPQACVDYLASAKRLKEVDIKKDEVKGFLNYMLELPPADFTKEMGRLVEVVKEDWYEIEQDLMPKRSKYQIAA